MSSLNFMELCRLCLVKERVSIPIFEGEGDVRQILLKIGACLPVKVARDDKLPKKICDECMFKLDSAYQFWNSSASAEKQLLQWLGDATNEDRKNVPSNTIETEQLVLKEEAIDQDTPEPSKNLNRVETVLDDERGASDDDEDSESEEEGSNSEETGDDEPPGKEEAESEEEPYEPLEPTTFVNVSLAGSDEAGPSGIQQPAQAAVAQPGQSQQPSQLAPSTSSAAGAASTAASATTAAVAPSPTSAAAVASTPSGSSLMMYTLVSPASVLYSCGVCGLFFNQQERLAAHKKFHDVTEDNYICKVCTKVCKSHFLLARHMVVHKKKQCKICKKEFKIQNALTKHMVVHMNERPFSCDICGKKFKRQFSVTDHKQRIHVGLEKKLDCKLCEYKTSNKSCLDIHMRRHFKDYTCFCDVCGKGFYVANELKLHKNLHDFEKSYQCELCDMTFLMRGHLNHHYITVHNKAQYKRKVYNCETCGKNIRRKSDYFKHLRRHTGEKDTYLCDICGKGVSSQESLVTHKRVHTGERPYECGDCGKCFSRRQSLQMHVRTHTGERPFSCKECGKSFTQQSTLIVHKRYHTGQRPYKCQLCEKGFVTLTLLKTHQKVPCV